MPRVLVVEDEVLTALMYQGELEDAGWQVIGPAHSMAAAHRLLDAETPDVALLDINLGGEFVWPVAMRLHALRVPLVFVTAHHHLGDALPAFAREYPRLDKPVHIARLLERLADQALGHSSISNSMTSGPAIGPLAQA